MFRFLLILTFVCLPFVLSQVLNRVRIVDHREYMIDVISETVNELERREWSSLKLSDIIQDINEQIIYWQFNSTVHYTNGFLVSIQHLDIRNDSLNQIWTESEDEETVTVELRGLLRMLDVALGYDVSVNLEGENHHYTGVIVQPLVTFTFSVFKNLHLQNMTITVTGDQPGTSNMMQMLPEDRISDAISVLFDPLSTSEGVTSWATEVLLPIVMDVVNSKVPFPELCYDCPMV